MDTGESMNSRFEAPLKEVDSDIYQAIQDETRRQVGQLEMIAHSGSQANMSVYLTALN